MLIIEASVNTASKIDSESGFELISVRKVTKDVMLQVMEMNDLIS